MSELCYALRFRQSTDDPSDDYFDVHSVVEMMALLAKHKEQAPQAGACSGATRPPSRPDSTRPTTPFPRTRAARSSSWSDPIEGESSRRPGDLLQESRIPISSCATSSPAPMTAISRFCVTTGGDPSATATSTSREVIRLNRTSVDPDFADQPPVPLRTGPLVPEPTGSTRSRRPSFVVARTSRSSGELLQGGGERDRPRTTPTIELCAQLR